MYVAGFLIRNRLRYKRQILRYHCPVVQTSPQRQHSGKRRRFAIALLVLVVVLGPVLVRQIAPLPPRQLTGVALEETSYTEISFRNNAQDIDLAGMLFLPGGVRSSPGVVIIHGSGTSRRNNRWYLTLTRHLQDNGVAVLLPDKRGSEKSGGDWWTSDFHDLATDTNAAVQYLQSRREVDSSRIGVIGMSQGGWIAPIVAADSDDLSFLVSMVGATVTPRDQLAYEENHNVRQMGFLPGVSNVVAFVSTAVIQYIAQPDYWDLIGDFDPLPYWRDNDTPALVLLGADDTNVPSAESAARLRALGNDRITIRTYEGSGHALESPVGAGDSIIRADALDDILSFIISCCVS